MDLKTLQERLDYLKEMFNNEEARLKRVYALSNNIISKGDKISDKSTTIIVESIGVHLSTPPQCVYYGVELTKLGIPNKKNTKSRIYQENIKKDANK